jgi:hypothetical protein
MIARTALTIRIRYLVAGLVLGLVWVWHADEPLWEHVLRLVIVVLILAPLLRLAPQVLGVRRVRTRGVSWPRLLAAKVPLLALAVVADWGLRHWVTATASGLVTGGALAAAVATLGPVLHTRLFVAVPGARQTIGVRGHGQPGGLEAGSRERASRPARPGPRPGPRSRRRVAVRLGGAALVLIAGFLLRHFAVYWILRHGLSDSGLAVEAALGAVLAALAIAAWVRHRRPAARHAAAHMNEARMNERPFTEEAGHAVTQHLADHVRSAPGQRDGVRRRPGGADAAH